MSVLPYREDIVYGSTKKYNAVASVAFRQNKADSHCNQVHGYGINVKATFETEELDARSWVVDFGSLKSFKGWLENFFDHVTLVAEDDPNLDWYKEADSRGVLTLNIVPSTGCESMARFIFEYLEQWLKDNGYSPRVTLARLEVWEHDGNSAYVRRK